MAYIPHNWKHLELLTAEDLNHMEQGILNEQIGPQGPPGESPHIGENGNWWIGETDTEIPATGPRGAKGDTGLTGPEGPPGQTPYIGENGNWWIGETDTGVSATGNFSGVSSFNGRSGAVSPSAGDYTAAQVGFTPGTTGMTAQNVQSAITELFQSVSEGKSLIASAVTDKGVETAADDSFQVMHDNILAISTVPDGLHTISVQPNDVTMGSVSGSGLASEGMLVTVSAVAEDGYDFDGWKESGETVSEDLEYFFLVERDRILFAQFVEKKNKIPDGYTEVEYIYWSGLSTGFALLENIVCNKDRLYLKFYPESYGTVSSSQYIFSAVLMSSGHTISFGSTSSNGLKYYINATSPNYLTISVVNALLEFDVDFLNGKYTVNGISMAGVRDSHSIGDTHKWLGVTGTNASLVSAKGKFYRLTHYRNGEVIHDYVPCINSNGIAGIFDINSGVFIQNTKTGATEITAGPAV